MRIVLALVLTSLLAGCITDNSVKDGELTEKEFSTVCLDGVSYWIRAADRKGYLAVRIDPATLQPKPCK